MHFQMRLILKKSVFNSKMTCRLEILAGLLTAYGDVNQDCKRFLVPKLGNLS